ncbi:MAG: PEP-CTERM sorting domain-containing protein, partial [Planctomycetaceae bacterium]
GPVHGQLQFNSGASTPTYTPTTTGTALSAYTGTVAFSTNVTSSGPYPDTIDNFAGKTFNQGVAPTSVSWDGSTITINFGTLGSFTGTNDNASVEGANSSTVNYSGTFTPGSAFTGSGLSATAAQLSIGINRAAGQNGGLGTATPNLSGTLTVADEFNPTVPEPTTYALAAFGAIAMGVVARRRRA